MARSAPRFDPDGPPDAMRWSLERLLTRGLVDEDSSGRLVPAGAVRWAYSSDSLALTFHLRPGLRFTDGGRCRSQAFRAAFEAGLQRADHATAAWALGALKGVDAVRAGRALPPLGIETPDDSTLVLRLARPDPLLLRRLALPGIACPWVARAPADGWRGAVGLGPYRVRIEELGRRLVLARAMRSPGADTLVIRFGGGLGRARSVLRAGSTDIVWPLPPGLAGEVLPAAYRVSIEPAAPLRRLMLVMRADLPPTTRLAARAALAHGINRSELVRLLGPGAREGEAWLAGAPAFEFPKLDAREVEGWLDRGHLPHSFHAVMAYDADGAGAAIARAMQGEWSRLGLYVDLMPLRGQALENESLRGSKAHLALVEWQPPLDDAAAQLAYLVMPLRGPAVGVVRSGWRTREFDAWLRPRRAPPALDPAAAQARLEQEIIALPVAELAWTWVERRGVPGVHLHPHFGPEAAAPVTFEGVAR